MEHDPQLAERAEYFDAQHEDDQEGAQRHLPFPDPPGAEPQRRHRAHGHAGIGDAAREGIRPEHAHGAVKEIMPLLREHPRPRAALAEGLERGQTLEGVEKLRAEGGIGLLAGEALPAVLAMPEGRRDQRHPRGREQNQGNGQIDEGDEDEDEHRRERGDGELGQVLAEIDFELLDAFHHGEDHIASAGAGEMGGAEGRHALIDGLAERALHACRRLVGRHRAPVVQRATE